jgi:hypothetical protein
MVNRVNFDFLKDGCILKRVYFTTQSLIENSPRRVNWEKPHLRSFCKGIEKSGVRDFRLQGDRIISCETGIAELVSLTFHTFHQSL